MAHANENEGHVQFSEEVEKHHSAVTIQVCSEDNIQAHVGFLQLNHRYELQLPLPVHNPPEKYQLQLQPSLAVKSATLKVDKGILLVVMEFLAHKQKLMRENVIIKGPEGSKNVTLCVNARVLGNGQGTPMLLDGVRLLGAVPVEDSEVSDWQGFE